MERENEKMARWSNQITKMESRDEETTAEKTMRLMSEGERIDLEDDLDWDDDNVLGEQKMYADLLANFDSDIEKNYIAALEYADEQIHLMMDEGEYVVVATDHFNTLTLSDEGGKGEKKDLSGMNEFLEQQEEIQNRARKRWAAVSGKTRKDSSLRIQDVKKVLQNPDVDHEFCRKVAESILEKVEGKFEIPDDRYAAAVAKTKELAKEHGWTINLSNIDFWLHQVIFSCIGSGIEIDLGKEEYKKNALEADIALSVWKSQATGFQTALSEENSLKLKDLIDGLSRQFSLAFTEEARVQIESVLSQNIDLSIDILSELQKLEANPAYQTRMKKIHGDGYEDYIKARIKENIAKIKDGVVINF